MRSIFFRTLLLTTLIAAAAYAQFAQGGQNAFPGQMFVGEKLVYEGKFNKALLRGISIGEMTFYAAMGTDPGHLLIKSEAVSQGTLLKMFKVSFMVQYETSVALDTFRVETSKKHDVQKDRVRDGDAVFDYKGKRVIYIETDPNNPTGPPRRIASTIESPMHDIASGIYELRLMPLKVGQTFVMQVSDSGMVYKIPVSVRAREQQKTVLGNVWCLRIEPDIFGKGKLIERKGKMAIWLTDDARHVPVRTTVDTEYGRIDIKLKSVTKPN